MFEYVMLLYKNESVLCIKRKPFMLGPCLPAWWMKKTACRTRNTVSAIALPNPQVAPDLCKLYEIIPFLLRRWRRRRRTNC